MYQETSMGQAVDSDATLDASPRGSGGETVAELREEMLEHLVDIVRKDVKRPRGHQTAVTAIKTFMEATSQKPRELILQWLDGDRAAYERWLRAELAEIEAAK